jgi:hypothetical protein
MSAAAAVRSGSPRLLATIGRSVFHSPQLVQRPTHFSDSVSQTPQM